MRTNVSIHSIIDPTFFSWYIFVFKGWLVLQRQQGKLTRTSTCPSAIALSDSDAAIRVRSLRMFLRLFSSLDLFLHGHIRLSVDITKGILVSQLRLKIKKKTISNDDADAIFKNSVQFHYFFCHSCDSIRQLNKDLGRRDCRHPVRY